MRQRLSDSLISKLPRPERGQVFHRDSEVPGLAIRLTPGAAAWVVEKRLGSRVVRVTLGKFPILNTYQARQRAREVLADIAMGQDPVEKKRTERAQKAKLREVWTAYITANAHRWSERHRLDHERVAHPGGAQKKRGAGVTEPGPLAALMDIRLDKLTPEKIAAWLKAEAARRPTRAALAFRLLRACLNWAASHPDYAKVLPENVTDARAVKDHVPRVKAKEGDVLQREQLPAWFAAVRALPPVVSAYLQTLLLTGARREELAGLRWADVDFEWKSLTIRDKVEGERTIPLTPYVATLLNGLPRRNEYVFSSPTSASGRLMEPRIAHDRALAAAGLPHVSLHGLRRSFGTLAEWVEAPTGVVAQIMGHKPSALAEKHYRRRPLDLLRMWHVRIEAWILEQAGIAQPSEEQPRLRVVGA